MSATASDDEQRFANRVFEYFESNVHRVANLPTVSRVGLEKAFPQSELVVVFLLPRSSTEIGGWRYPLFTDEAGVPTGPDLAAISDTYPAYRDPERFAVELLIEFEEGTRGRLWDFGAPDAEGIRWVVE